MFTMNNLALVSLTLITHIFLFAMAQEPSEAPLKLNHERQVHQSYHKFEESVIAEGPDIRRMGKHHHSHSSDVAGGGVIIGGLVTATFAVVFCYLRVTRKKDGGDGVDPLFK